MSYKTQLNLFLNKIFFLTIFIGSVSGGFQILKHFVFVSIISCVLEFGEGPESTPVIDLNHLTLDITDTPGPFQFTF